MQQTIITNANVVLNFTVKGKNVILELLVGSYKMYKMCSYVLRFKKFKGMPLLKRGQQIQVRISRDPGINITPTFFDSKQRCKECGRFYTLYCKHCYERFKNYSATIYKFYQEYLKGLENE